MSFGEGDLHLKIGELEKDNGELRVLVKDFANASCHTCYPFTPWFRCGYFNGSECELVNRARELGVEVDE